MAIMDIMMPIMELTAAVMPGVWARLRPVVVISFLTSDSSAERLRLTVSDSIGTNNKKPAVDRVDGGWS